MERDYLCYHDVNFVNCNYNYFTSTIAPKPPLSSSISPSCRLISPQPWDTGSSTFQPSLQALLRDLHIKHPLQASPHHVPPVLHHQQAPHGLWAREHPWPCLVSANAPQIWIITKMRLNIKSEGGKTLPRFEIAKRYSSS